MSSLRVVRHFCRDTYRYLFWGPRWTMLRAILTSTVASLYRLCWCRWLLVLMKSRIQSQAFVLMLRQAAICRSMTAWWRAECPRCSYYLHLGMHIAGKDKYVTDLHNNSSSVWVGISHSVQRQATGWRFDLLKGSEIFLYFTGSRPALGPTQPPMQWIRGASSSGVKWPVRAADHSPPSSIEMKNGGAIPPLLHTCTCLWHAFS
jgi:hypothetical protein